MPRAVAGPERAAAAAGAWPLRALNWPAARRLIPTLYPPRNLFDRVADEKDFDALVALEGLSNERLRNEVGQIELVPRQERVYGPGTGTVMAAFTYLNPQGSRFSRGLYGVLYAARDRATAVAETQHHRAAFLRATHQGPMHLPMREYRLHIEARLHDVSLDEAAHQEAWAAAQAIGGCLQAKGSAGLKYRSVRDAERRPCVALFKPKAVKSCVQAALLLYVWDGETFSDVFEQWAA
jgi:RES domain-containing protein